MTVGRSSRIALLIAARFVLSAAAQMGPLTTRHAQIELVPETTTIQPDVPFLVAMVIRIEPRWHTYWLNPGMAGAAPRIDWILPPGFRVDSMEWPYPERLLAGDVMSFGYEDWTAMLSTIVPPSAEEIVGVRVALSARVNIFLCRERCLLESGVVDMRPVLVSTGPPVPNPEFIPIYERLRPRLPVPPEGFALSARMEQGHFRLFVQPPEPFGPIDGAEFFPLVGDLIYYTERQTWTETDDGYVLAMPAVPAPRSPPRRLLGVLVLRHAEGTTAIEVDVPLRGEQM